MFNLEKASDEQRHVMVDAYTAEADGYKTRHTATDDPAEKEKYKQREAEARRLAKLWDAGGKKKKPAAAADTSED